MRCAISYYLYKFKNVKNAHEEVLHLVKLQTKACNFTKFTRSNTPPWVFSRFLNCANGTKSRKASHILKRTNQGYSENSKVLRNSRKIMEKLYGEGFCHDIFCFIVHPQEIDIMSDSHVVNI